MKKQRKTMRLKLTMIFILLVFCIFTITMAVMGLAVFLLIRIGVLTEVTVPNAVVPLITAAIVSIIVGTVIGAMMSSIPLRPLDQLITGMNQLACGHYETKIDLGRHSVGKQLEDSFHSLAAELQNTEMLRSDFVNNFSHEFKTPIVSIRGFAKLLQKGTLTPQKQQEYLDIIAAESSRLADMASNMLDLTKVENQIILTGITRFNLSEQLRSCVLLLEKIWSRKNLTMNVDFGEYEIEGNEEQLKQVWINLLDNAIKFSGENGEIDLDIKKSPDTIAVSITNSGETIRDEDKDMIFRKFYQADTSHASPGNGIGLAIVKKIVELHSGTVSVSSFSGVTSFCAELPVKE